MELATATRTNTDISLPVYGSYTACIAPKSRETDILSGLANSLRSLDSTSRAHYVKAITSSLDTDTKLVLHAPYVLPAANSPTALDIALGGIRRLANLEHDWDGYGSSAPKQSARDDAEVFASFNAGLLEMALPRISAASDGEVNYYWKNARGLLDLGFYGDGTYSFYAELADGREFAADEVAINQALPNELIQLFKAV